MTLIIFKMIATSGFLTALSAPNSLADPTGRAYSAPPDPLAGLRGPTSKEKGMDSGKGEGRERKGTGARDRPLFANSSIRPC